MKKGKKILCTLLAVLLMVGSLPLSAEAAVPSSTVIANAKALVGKYPYVSGGYSPSHGGFDCSGFVYYVYHSLSGINITLDQAGRSRSKLAAAGTRITGMSNFRPADIVQFTGGHVAIYIGNNQIVEAAKPGTKIRIRTVYASEVAYAVRLPQISGTTPLPVPKAPVISSAKREYLSTDYINFTWTSVPNATDYFVYMWKDGVQLYQTDMGTSLSFTSAPTSAGSYQLIVRAGNSSGYSNEPNGFSFTVRDPSVPKAPVISSAKHEYLSTDYIKFTWTSVPNATDYFVYMWKDGVQLYQTDMGIALSFTSAPTSAGEYLFIVRAGNSAGYSNEPNGFSFVVKDPHTTHIWNNGTVTKPSTEEETGIMTYTCKECGATKTETIIKLPHIEHRWDEGVVVKEPTETEPGLKVYTCTSPVCNETMEEEIPPLNGDTPLDPTPENDFIDVPNGAYFANAVNWAVENDITAGTGKTTFSPNAVCTRAQAVTFLWRYAGSPKPAVSSSKFTDVAPGQYYTDAVIWAVEKGITGGVSATRFAPDDKCTRAQIVSFLHRMNGSPSVSGVSPFLDVPPSLYYANSVAWAVEKGITMGTSTTLFSPHNDCSRGQIVTFLYRYAG